MQQEGTLNFKTFLIQFMVFLPVNWQQVSVQDWIIVFACLRADTNFNSKQDTVILLI